MTSTTHEEKMGAYAAHQAKEEDPREIDRRALLSCASRLKAALDDGGKDMAAYAEAIRFNQKLWTLFQVALCDPENQLPREIKANLLSLSRYIDRASFRAITGFAPAELSSLISLNRTIAAGLAKKPTAAAPTPRVEQQVPQQPPTSVMTTA